MEILALGMVAILQQVHEEVSETFLKTIFFKTNVLYFAAVVDYQNTPNNSMNNTLLTPSINRSRMSPSHQASPSSANTPTSPSHRVGRALYSTRQNFQ